MYTPFAGGKWQRGATAWRQLDAYLQYIDVEVLQFFAAA